MKTIRLVLGVLAAAGFAAALCAQSAKELTKADPGFPAYVRAKTLYAQHDLRGQKLPKIEVQKWLTAQPETKGKVVLLDIWATWCPPCRELIPELNKYQAKFKQDLVVIGLSDETPETLQKFMKTTKIEYPVGTDIKKTTETLLGVQGIPHTLIITPDHVVRWQGFPGSGEDPLTEDTVATVIKAWKAKKS